MSSTDAAPTGDAPMLAWALWCARRGFRVYPLHHPTKTSSNPDEARCSCSRAKCGTRTGKHPRVTRWQASATTDESSLAEWWRTWPRANVGIYTGDGDLLVLDEDGDDGRDSLRALERAHRQLPPTFTVASGRGVHRYFAKPRSAIVRNSVRVAPGLDVRSDGAFGGGIVGPGSLHFSGQRYQVENDSPIADATAWLLTLLSQYAGGKPLAPDIDSGAVGEMDEGQRGVGMRIPIEERRKRAVAYVAKAAPAETGHGGHNVAMRVATAVVRGFALDPATARDVLTEWNQRCIPPWSEAELAHKIADAARVGTMPWGAKLIERSSEGFVFRDADGLEALAVSEEYLLPHFRIAPGRPTLLGGYAGVGKTLLAQELALVVAADWPKCWGHVDVGRTGRVLHLDFEMGDAALAERYRRLAAGMRLKFAALRDSLSICSMPRLYLSSDAAIVEAELRGACDGAVLVVVDNLRSACPHAKSENDSAMRTYLDILTRVSIETGCIFLVIVHETKQHGDTAGRPSSQRVRGSGAIVDAAGGVLSVGMTAKALRIEQTKASHGPRGETVFVRLVDEGRAVNDGPPPKLKVVGHSAGAEKDTAMSAGIARAEQAIVEYLAAQVKPVSVRELLKAARGRGESKKAALDALRSSGRVIQECGAHGARLLRLASGGGDDRDG